MIVLIGGDAIGSFVVCRRFVYYLFISMYAYLIDLPSQCMLSLALTVEGYGSNLEQPLGDAKRTTIIVL